jgi:homoserine kinase
MSKARSATAFAPASVANVAVGFDILGFSMDLAGDRITVTEDRGGTGVTVESITGVVTELPRDARKNTASVALQAMLDDLKPGLGFRVAIDKGLPLGSGMGGSAASSVGAVVAADALLGSKLSREKLLKYALAGETAASGSAHADNIAPCLYGGLTLALSLDPLRIVQVPTPPELQCVLVHPHIKVETRHARSILKPTLLLQEHVHQSAHLAAFISACHSGDLELISASMIDLLIEPQRAELIPGFYEAKSEAIAQGALGFSISGSGPSVFAWASSSNGAARVKAAIERVFSAHKIGVDSWVAPVRCSGARVLSCDT